MSTTPPSSPAPIESWEVLDLLASLVQKSLVVYEEDEQGRGRYRLLETVRQYARDRLLEAGNAEAVRTRHLGFFLDWAEQGPGDERLEAEHDNLRAALAWSGAQAQGEVALRLGVALQWFWAMRGYWTEGREHLAGLLALPGAEARTAERGTALHGAGWLARNQGDYGAARALFEESLAIYQERDDKGGIAWSLWRLGAVALAQGDYGTARALLEEGLAIFRGLGDKGGIPHLLGSLGAVALAQGGYGAARALFEESLAIYRELEDRLGIARSLHLLGTAARGQGDHGAARALWEESLAIQRELGDKGGIALSLGWLGDAARDQRDYGAARVLHDESLAICRETGDKQGAARNLEGLAALAVAQAQPERAARLFGAAEGLRAAMGAPLSPAERAEHDRAVAAVRTALGELAFAAAWAEGRAMPMEAAIQYALGDGDA